jgi:hypothetical protein
MAGRPSGRFRVEAFRVPTMKALLQGPKTPPCRQAVALDAQISTCPAAPANAPVQLRTVVQDKSVSFADYPNSASATATSRSASRNAAAGFDDDEGMFRMKAKAAAAPARRQRARKS